jgi:hypothetical protein
MSKSIRVRKLPLVPLYRASGRKSNSLSAYGLTEEQAIARLKESRRTNRFTPSDVLELVFW